VNATAGELCDMTYSSHLTVVHERGVPNLNSFRSFPRIRLRKRAMVSGGRADMTAERNINFRSFSRPLRRCADYVLLIFRIRSGNGPMRARSEVGGRINFRPVSR